MMEIGICTSVTNAAALAESGVDFIEENVQGFLVPAQDDAAFAAHRQQAATASLPVRAANCFLPATLKCVGPQVDRPRLERYAATAFARAARVGIRWIVFGSGGARQIPEGFPATTARGQFVDLLRALGPLADRQDVGMVLEPLNRGECNFINTVTEGAAIVRECGHPRVRLLADLYHMLRNGEAPATLEPLGDLLAHVHLAEGEKRTAPGTAGDDFRPWLRALRNGGYDGALSIECGWTDLAAQAAPSVRALREQWAAAGQ